MRYRVTAEYVTARTAGRKAPTTIFGQADTPVVVQGYSRGMLLPDDTEQESIGHLSRVGFIEPVPD